MFFPKIMRYFKTLRHYCVLLLPAVMVLSVVSAASARPTLDWPVLTRGDTDYNSARVTMLQYLLRQRGYRVAVDGRYGLGTQQQVLRFQRTRHLKVTGVVSGPTWRSLILKLHRGQQGDAVRAVQSSLQQFVDQQPFVDGRFGLRTEQAVRAFQKQNGLREDGIVGPETWVRLTEVVAD